MTLRTLAFAIVFTIFMITRAAAATYTVDRLDDANVTACTLAANDCTLRGAINAANAAGGTNTIAFNVGGGSGLPQTISLLSELPTITTNLTIDGTTQPSWGGFPVIELNGSSAGANTNGLNFSSPISNAFITIAVKGLVINRFNGHGIAIGCTGGVNASVTGNYIGVNPGGTVAQGNAADGVFILAYPNSIFSVGGTVGNQRNVISANGINGVQILTASSVLSANTTVDVYNNFIGLTAGGNALGNASNGINVDQSLPGSINNGYIINVGGATTTTRNYISGNQIGIAGTTGNLNVYNNYIGTNSNGTIAAPNTLDGIQLTGPVNAQIGGTLTIANLPFAAGNVISGNSRYGVWVKSAQVSAVIQTNNIGTNPAGTSALANGSDGIYLSENSTYTTSSITIGSSTSASDGNVISGNLGDGIDIEEHVRAVKIYANKVGTNAAATAAIPNASAGIRVLSSQNAIGAIGNSTAANTISGNNLIGIMLVGVQSTGNTIVGNYIGTSLSGATVGNAQDGIYVNQSASGNSIGNGLASGTNTIAYNGNNGVNVADGQTTFIRANSIHSNAALGIDLNSDGVTLNDVGDGDAGPNGLQNYPIISNASPSQLSGTLNSTPNSPFTMDFYRVDSCDNSGNGEGRYFLGSKNVNVTNNGVGQFNYFDFNLTLGQIITATATDASGNTSEFSPCYTVNPAPGNFSFSSATYSTSEGGGTKTIVVNRTGGSYGTSQVNYATLGVTATPGADYTPVSGTLVFNNGEVVKTFDIPILEDQINENDETLNVSLSFPTNGSILVAPNTAVLTIVDNDPPPAISIGDVSQLEGNQGTTQFSFQVSLSGPSGLPITVNFATTDGTATASSDYLAASGQLTFQPGETVKNIPVSVFGDLVPELDETFFVNLTNPVNASIAKGQGLGTILDDDNPGKFAFAFAPYSGIEHSQVTVTVTRTGGSAGTVSVDYATQGGTATPGIDYTPTAGTLVFGNGETVKTFSVNLLDDNIPEPAETVNLILSNPIGGAILGAPSTAVLNIIDNDSGTLLNIAGVVRKTDSTPIPNVTMTLQGAQNATTQTDAGGRYSFANLAPNSNYTVTPSALGYTFAPISQQLTNMTADQLSVNFVGTPAPSRQLLVIGGNTTPGQNVQATVELVAQGDENSVGFSLNYDPAVLSSPSVTLNPDAAAANLLFNSSQTGKLGVLLSLPAGQALPVGTRTLVTVTFATGATNLYNSPLTFGDIPIAKEIANFNADPLPTTYSDGAVTFAQGYEGDVAPRPTGNNNGTVTVADVTQIGRFVAGLDTLNASYNEFQRADCAPRITLGNGLITVADYTQAGRYAAGLDIVSPSGGASSANFAAVPHSQGPDRPDAGSTTVRVVSNSASPGQQVTISIETDAQGTENGFGFTLNYDSSKLSNPLISKGTDTQSATLIPNLNQTGRVGVVLAMPFGQSIVAGTKQLVTVRFDVSANAAGGALPLTLGDAPVQREVSDVDANVLSSIFTDGTLTILGPTAAGVSVSGVVLTSDGRPVSGAELRIADSSGVVKTALSNPFGYFKFTDIPAGDNYVVSAASKRFNFRSQLLAITTSVTNLVVLGQPKQ